MRVNQATGLLEGVRYVASPNCDSRPEDTALEVLVIHSISLPPGEFGGDDVEALFCNRLRAESHPAYRDIAGLRVSAHLFVRRSGEIVQFVPLHLRAWHAGVSEYRGRSRVNDFSIGIELEGSDHRPYTDAQYAVLTELSVALLDAYPTLRSSAIVGHSDVAPGRKTDPGPYFEWGRYRRALSQRLAGEARPL
ncbi:MAG TPA: 1,6-anhydro-N-acetylmuramyl-L-alanine amidase AmpD [Acidiferrobacteraceae bacterium]|nr:1,6-anhydro-N-acetylmuramyl-L-alanine amidase AmpD [Acidiferrobacteraceae bacterium]